MEIHLGAELNAEVRGNVSALSLYYISGANAMLRELTGDNSNNRTIPLLRDYLKANDSLANAIRHLIGKDGLFPNDPGEMGDAEEDVDALLDARAEMFKCFFEKQQLQTCKRTSEVAQFEFTAMGLLLRDLLNAVSLAKSRAQQRPPWSQAKNWSYFICEVRWLFQKNKLPWQVSKRDRDFPSPFTKFVLALQNTFPNDVQKHNGDAGALATAIQRARNPLAKPGRSSATDLRSTDWRT